MAQLGMVHVKVLFEDGEGHTYPIVLPGVWSDGEVLYAAHGLVSEFAEEGVIQPNGRLEPLSLERTEHCCPIFEFEEGDG
jgi:hypothetical protein